MVYFVAMGFAGLFLLSAALEAFSVLIRGPSWKALWTTTGSLMLALICFLIGMAFYSPSPKASAIAPQHFSQANPAKL